jgi:hypothetical protein
MLIAMQARLLETYGHARLDNRQPPCMVHLDDTVRPLGQQDDAAIEGAGSTRQTSPCPLVTTGVFAEAADWIVAATPVISDSSLR